MPDFEIKEWNQETFGFERHRQQNRFFDLVCKEGLWAFIADYVRLQVLISEGGLYLDTDVQVLRDFTPLLHHDVFMGMRSDEQLVEPAIIGAKAGAAPIKAMLDFYDEEVWRSPDFLMPDISTKVIVKRYGLKELKDEDQYFSKDDFQIYKSDLLFPYTPQEIISPDFHQKKLSTAYSIHWWTNSGYNLSRQYKMKTKHLPKSVRVKKEISHYIKTYIAKPIDRLLGFKKLKRALRKARNEA